MATTSIQQYVNQPEISNRIKELLDDRAGDFIISLTSIASQNDLLSKCDPKSLVMAALTATAMRLPINPGMGMIFLIPYKNRDGSYTAQLQLGFKSFIQLAMRSGQFKTLNVTEVKQGELQNIDRLTGELELEWNTTEQRDSLPTTGYIAYFQLLNGFEKALYMTVVEIQKHGMKYSQSFKRGYGLWRDNFDSMAKKTVIKLLLSRYAPMNTEMQTAKEADQAIITDQGYEYPDNDQLSLEEEAGIKEHQRIASHIEAATTVAELEKCLSGINQVENDELFQAYTTKKVQLTKEKKK